ncbi:Mur ligase family protein, partial [Bacillus sp. WP8]|uniref:Mur ligase family protein n=1 Tax=Bacillus sp. WP8 TaxID=756828 RepID=UPI0021B28CDC
LPKSYLKEENPRLLPITPTNPKTTTKHIIHSLFQTPYQLHKTHPNFNNHIPLPLTILPIPQPTHIPLFHIAMTPKAQIQFLSHLPHPHPTLITNIPQSHIQHLPSTQPIPHPKYHILKPLKQHPLFYYLP